MEEAQILLDQFAASALNALITKMPFLDKEGKIGEKVGEDELLQIKKNLAKSAYEYASWMLIAREEQKEWLKENEAAFKQSNQ